MGSSMGKVKTPIRLLKPIPKSRGKEAVPSDKSHKNTQRQRRIKMRQMFDKDMRERVVAHNIWEEGHTSRNIGVGVLNGRVV